MSLSGPHRRWSSEVFSLSSWQISLLCEDSVYALARKQLSQLLKRWETELRCTLILIFIVALCHRPYLGTVKLTVCPNADVPLIGMDELTFTLVWVELGALDLTE